MNQLVNSMTVLLSAIIGVAILSVLVSKNSNTTGVIGAASTGFEGILGAAEGPITGNGVGAGTGLGSLGSNQFGFTMAGSGY
jgi:hypothetical protein